MIKMNVRITIIFSIMLICAKLSAQPGGGGGLEIHRLYNNKLETIDILTDTSLKIRAFLLSGETIYQETFIYQKMVKKNKKADDVEAFGLGPMYITENNPFYYKYDIASIGLGPMYVDGERYLKDSNQRMFIVYKKDTMIVDFIGVMSPNGGGDRDRMDSLVIQKGYFKYFRTNQNSNNYYPYSNILSNGLTLYTAPLLLNKGYAAYISTIDLSFLDERSLPVSYFLKSAEYYIQNDQAARAFIDIDKAIQKNNGNETCETLYLLCDAYTKTAQYEKALETISSIINCQCYRPYRYGRSLEDEKSRNYRKRIELFIKLKQYDNALVDYNSLYAIYKGGYYKTRTNVDRADFKIDYLKDYIGAITDLKKIIDAMSGNVLCYNYEGSDIYSSVYFSLARAEYLNGDKRSAFKHWLQAEDLGYRELSPYSEVIILIPS